MNAEVEKEEKLRESACTGDLQQMKTLLEKDHVNINSKNNMNGWTALHWACKRNHIPVVKYLLEHGADKTVQNSNKELPAQLTNTAEIRHILEYSGRSVDASPLPITPSYIKYPVFPYNSEADRGSAGDTNCAPVTQQANIHGPQVNGYPENRIPTNPAELVLKARIAYSTERDFIEVELDRQHLTFEALVSLLTTELGIDRHLVYKIRKLPNTIVRKDKDVCRLMDFQELELVLTNKAMSASHRVYEGDIGEAFKHEQILY